MATIEVTCNPNPAQEGGGVVLIASIDPTPPGETHIWFSIGKVQISPQLTAAYGQASFPKSGLAAGTYYVTADFATADDSGSSDAVQLDVLAPSPAEPLPPPTQDSTPDQSQAGVQNPVPDNISAGMQAASNAFNGVSNVDPFTGAPAIDPYTGEPLSERDASLSDRIRAFYSQPEAVPDSTRNAILDFYHSPAIDLSGIPQSIQNSIFDIFSQVPEPPLPGRGLDEFLSDTFSSVLGDLISGIRSEVGGISTVLDVLTNADALALQATGRTLRPFFGAAQAIGGVGEIIGGVVFAAGTEGLGSGFGVALAAHGLDQLIAGVRTVLGEDAQSLTQYILTDALKPGFGPNASLVAGVADAAFSLGLNSVAELGEVGGIGVRSLSMEAAATRIELSESMQLGGEVKSIVAPAAEMATEYSEVPRPEIATISSKWSMGTKMEQEVAAAQNNIVAVPEKDIVAVEYVGTRRVTSEKSWAVHQIAVTGSDVEGGFRITENGVPTTFWADGASTDGYLLEAKEGLMGINQRRSWHQDMYDQARRYLIVTDLMGYKGTRYLVSDVYKVKPLTDLFMQWFPDAMNSGMLSVEWAPTP